MPNVPSPRVPPTRENELTLARRALSVIILAAALSLPAATNADGGLDVAASIARDTTDLRLEDGGVAESRYTRLGVEIWQRYRSWFQPGLTGGVGWMSLRGDLDSRGFSLSGEWLGLQLRSEVPVTDDVGLIGQLGWIYHQIDGSRDGERLELDWYDTEARLGVRASLGDVTLEAGGSWRDIDGEQSGSPVAGVDFEADDATGAYLAAWLAVDRTGRIGLRAETGHRRGVRLDFARRF